MTKGTSVPFFSSEVQSGGALFARMIRAIRLDGCRL